MRPVLLPYLSVISLLGIAGFARTGEEPQVILAKAVQALGGEVNISRAKAVKAKIKGTIHLLDGAKFTGEIITQLPAQVKLVLNVDVNGLRVSSTRVLNGHKAWNRDNNEPTQADDAASLLDFEQSAYVDYIASLVPLLKDKSYTLSVVSEVKVKDRAAVGVKVTSKGRPDVTLYFDKGTGLLIEIEHRRNDPTTKKEVLREEFFSDYQEVNPARIEEETLKAAKVTSDNSALLEYLRKQTLSDDTRKKIKGLIRRLGDSSFQVRQKTKEDLVAQGVTAAPLLTRALRDPDPEVAGLAKECLQKVGNTPDPAVSLAVIRLLALRKLPTAAEVLIRYLPSAPDETVAQEVLAALAAVAFQDGKPDKALVQALADKDPERQAAAAAVLGRDGATPPEQPGQRLLLPGLKRATKVMAYEDGKRTIEWEMTDIQIFNKLDDNVFSKP